MLTPVFFLPSCKGGLEIPSWTSGFAFVKRLSASCSLYFLILVLRAFSPCFWFHSDPGNNEGKKERGALVCSGDIRHVLAGGQSHERAVLVPRVGKGLLSTVSSWGPSGDNSWSVPWLALCSLGGEEDTTWKQNGGQFLCRQKNRYVQRKRCPVISPWGVMCGWIRPQMLLQEDHIVMVWDTLLPHAVPPRCLLLFFHDSLNFDVGCRKAFILSSPLGEELDLFCHWGRVHTALGFLHFSERRCNCDLWIAWVSSQIKTGTFVKSDRGLRMEEQFPT